MSYLGVVVITVLGVILCCDGCTCVRSDLYRSTRISQIVVEVQILDAGTLANNTALMRCYQGNVITTFKGPFSANDQISVCAAPFAATCGTTLQQDTYVLGGFLHYPQQVTISMCNLHQLAAELSDEERTFLNNRWNDAKGQCATGATASCFAEPCKGSNCAAKGAQCVDNYCNGCHAEWWDDRNDRACTQKNEQP